LKGTSPTRAQLHWSKSKAVEAHGYGIKYSRKEDYDLQKVILSLYIIELEKYFNSTLEIFFSPQIFVLSTF
jgi:hypothetical protein